MAIPFQESVVLGPLLIGVILNAMLYGVCVVQCFIYYQTYKRDATWMRYFVLYLFILESCNTVFDIALVFEPLVTNFGSPIAFSRIPTLMFLDALVTVLLSTPVQFFIAWRIRVVSESLVMPLVVAFFGTCSLIGGLTVGILTIFIRERAKLGRVEPALITWLVSSAAADVLITVSLSWSLTKRKTGMKNTDDQVARIVLMTIQTGFVTSVFSLADVIIFLLLPRTNINFVFDLPLSKLVTNSLLCTLNARAGWNNLSGAGADANLLFGQMSTLVKSDFNTLQSRSGFGRETAIRTDVIELGEIRQDLKVETLGHGVRVQKMVEHY